MDDKIKKLYLNGYDCFEISKQLNISEKSTKYIIDIRLKHYKELHLKNKSKRDNLRKKYTDFNIKDLYILGYNAKEIADEVGHKYENIQKYIQRNLKEFKDKHKKNRLKKEEYKKQIHKEHIKTLYIKGYNAKEIAGLLSFSHSYMREYISKNLSEQKIEHKKNRAIKKEMIKAVNNMNNSFIGNSAILDWNRQSYDYNENGNIVFNEKHGARPLDLPKTYYKRDSVIVNLGESGNIPNMVSPYSL